MSRQRYRIADYNRSCYSAKVPHRKEEDVFQSREYFMEQLKLYIVKRGKEVEKDLDHIVRRDSKELKVLFEKLKVNFDALPNKGVYIAVLQGFMKRTGVKVSHVINCLQDKFNGKFRITFSDPYDLVMRLEQKYQKFVLDRPGRIIPGKAVA